MYMFNVYAIIFSLDTSMKSKSLQTAVNLTQPSTKLLEYFMFSLLRGKLYIHNQNSLNFEKCLNEVAIRAFFN